jgi:hypothetical protein
MGDEDTGMSFSTETDFEGGQWIGSEFYYGKYFCLILLFKVSCDFVIL